MDGGVEGVGLEDVGAGFQIGAMDVGDDIRARERQEIVVALEIAAVILETLAAEIRFLELARLDHGAHGAVQQQDALARSRSSSAETVHGGFRYRWRAGRAALPVRGAARMPNRRQMARVSSGRLRV